MPYGFYNLSFFKLELVIMTVQKRRVLILGGGFGGIKAALELSSNPKFEVSLLSDQDNFRYYPTLFRMATGGKKTASSIPLDEIFNDKAVSIIKDGAKILDRTAKTVKGVSGAKYNYDDLIVALGAVTNFFDIKGLAEYSYGIKSLDEAGRLRAHLHKLIIDDGKPDLNYVIIGAGPTGVELAGALPAYLQHIIKQHKVPPKKINIELVEAAPKILPRMPRRYSRAVTKQLKRLGIKLYLGQAVEAETVDELMVGGKPIKSHTVVWTAGVTNHPFFKANGFALDEHGKVVVNPFLQAEDNIFVIGDNASTPYSGMAQTALYDAAFVSRNLVRVANGKRPEAYIPKRPVTIIPIGHGWAAVQWAKLCLFGRSGWLLRGFADFIAFHDFEPWWQAGQHLMAEFGEENDCKVCK